MAGGDPRKLLEGNGRYVRVGSVNCCGWLWRAVFRNWGRTVRSTPTETFFPVTKVGVQNIVRWAKANGKRVRAAGYRHTWSSFYVDDGQVFISMLPPKVAEKIPTPPYPYDPDRELGRIEELSTERVGNKTYRLIKVGTATTNEQLRVWLLKEKNWTIPLNVIMSAITLGGSNAPICHGSGWETKTLSDLVTELEYVNANGDLVTVNDKTLLRSAAGCFGLLGIVVSLTLRLDTMSCARMQPRARPVVLSIPPPRGYWVPRNVDLRGVTPAQKEEAFRAMVESFEKKYYNEYFWFPLQRECWINCWENDGNVNNAEIYPTNCESMMEAFFQAVLNFANIKIFRWLLPVISTSIIGWGAMKNLTQRQDYVVWLPDALHFVRGIQNLRCLDMEWEIPIPSLPDDETKPDWSIVQKCWWDVITSVYSRYNSSSKDMPLRLALELRVTGDSDIIMAPQHGNKLGTLAIEILSFSTVGSEVWLSFMQEITDKWSKYTDAKGIPLKIRPHWAKEWENLTVRGEPIVDYLKSVYADQIKIFKQDLEDIGSKQGVSLEQTRSMFSNKLLDELIFDTAA